MAVVGFVGSALNRMTAVPARKLEQFEGFVRELANNSSFVRSPMHASAMVPYATLFQTALSGGDVDGLVEEMLADEYNSDAGAGRRAGLERIAGQVVTRRDELVSQGVSIEEANKKATSYGFSLLEEERKSLLSEEWSASKELVSGWSENVMAGEPMGTGEGEYLDMWRNAEAYAYTYDFIPERAKQAQEDLAAGMEAAAVYEKNKNPWIEFGMQAILDPNWLLGLDNLFFKAVTKTLGVGGRGLVTGLSKIPPLKGSMRWLLDVTPATVGKRAAGAVNDVLREAWRFADNVGHIGRVYPTDLLTYADDVVLRSNATDYFTKAFLLFDDALSDDAIKSLSRRYSKEVVDEIIQKQLELAAKKIGRELTEQETEQIAEIALRRIMEEGQGKLPGFISEVQRLASSAAREAAEASAPKLAAAIRKFAPARFVQKAISTVNSALIWGWLQIRPSWVIFNYSDNLIKGLIDGINPFSSLPSMARKYAYYLHPSAQIDEAIETLSSSRLRNIFSTANNREAAQALSNLGVPHTALGTFAEGASGGGWSGFWSHMSERLEKTWRARKFFTDFQKYIDTVWPELLSVPVSAEIDGATVQVSAAVDAAIRATLGEMYNPSGSRVANALNKFLYDSVRLPTRLAEWDGFFKETPQEIREQIFRRYDDLVSLSNINGSVRLVDLQQVRDDAVQALRDYAKQQAETARRAFAESLPDQMGLFDADELYAQVIEGHARTPDGVLSAMTDMPAYERVVQLFDETEVDNLYEEVNRLRMAGRDAEAHQMVDEFFRRSDGRRYEAWNQWNAARRETMTRLSGELDEVLGREGSLPFVQRYLDSSEEYTELMKTVNDIKIGRVNSRNSYYRDLARNARELGVEPTDALGDWFTGQKARIQSDAHAALMDLKRFVLEAQGKTEDEIQHLLTLGPDNFWAGLDSEIEDIYRQSRREIEPMLNEVNAWFNNEARPLARANAITTQPITAQEREVIARYQEWISTQTERMLSDAQWAGIHGANKTYFDYETTTNLMHLLGGVFPFVRYPAMNYMYWLEKFSSVPRLAITISRLREVQAWYNRDLPEKYRYTVKIPLPQGLLDSKFASMLGIDDESFRFNPWVFWSFASQMPGGNVFQMRELEELWSPETRDNYTALQRWNSILESLGFGVWPYMEYAAQAFGLLPPNYYVMDTAGVLGDVWKLASLIASGKDTGSPDEIIRKTLPVLWNTIIDDPDHQWETINKDMMEDYATGREIEGIIMKMPDDEVRALAEVSLLEREEILANTSEEDMLAYRRQVRTVFDMSPEEQVLAVQGMTPEHKVAFWLECEATARRDAMKRSLARAFAGHLTGIYLSGSTEAEIAAYQMRMSRRAQEQALPLGAQRRAITRQFYEENPKYGLIDSWRWGLYPYAETEISYEMETQDAIMSAAQSEYWDYNDQFQQRREQLSQEIYAANPGNKALLRYEMNKLYQERDAWIANLNERTNTVLQNRADAFVLAHGGDRRSAEILYTGFDTDVYVGTELSDAQKEMLLSYKKANPDDIEGYNDLFEIEWAKAREANPPIQTRHIPGLDEGYAMHFEFNINTHSDVEIGNYLVDQVIRSLKDSAPQYDDYDTYSEYSLARDEYMATLGDRAMELPEVQEQVDMLVKAGQTREEAEAAVRQWYTEERLQQSYMDNDTMEEAMEYVADKYYYSIANDYYNKEVKPLQEVDESLYYAAMDEFAEKFGELDAGRLFRYMVLEYSGKFDPTQESPWTIAEMQKRFGEMSLPSAIDRWTLASTGTKALDNWIDFYYNRLTSADKVMVQSAFGEDFLDYLETPNADTSKYSVELRGSWLNALAQASGEDAYDWRQLPGMTEYLESSGAEKDKAEFGLPKVAPFDRAEYEEAQRLDSLYWEYKNNGQEVPAELENSELRLKWFGADTPKSMWWDYYYKMIPPGKASAELRSSPIIQMVLDKDVRNAVATRQDYERALEYAESWVLVNASAISDLGLDPAEYEEVRRLSNIYYDLPSSAAKKAFLKENPLLAKYLNAELGGSSSSSSKKSSRRSGGGGGSSSSNASSDVWDAFTSAVGQSLNTVLGFLQVLWAGGELTVNQMEYLQKLWESLATGMTFEAWVSALQSAMPTGTSKSSSTGTTIRVPSSPKTVSVDFGTGGRGFRQISR
jgi:hypothetical protein